MADLTDRNLSHVFLSGVTDGVPYTSPSSGGGTEATFPARDRQPGYKSPGVSDSNRWEIGSDFRHRGALHQDTWVGPAAELASKPCLAVYPVNGWWRLRPFLKRFDSRIRYALIVSIRSEEQPVDLYTPIATQLGISVPVEV